MPKTIHLDTNVLIFTTTSTFQLQINDLPKIDSNPIFLASFKTIIGIITVDELDFLLYVTAETRLSGNILKIDKLSFISLHEQHQKNSKLSNLCKFIENNNFFYTEENIGDEFTWNRKMRTKFSKGILEWADWPEEDELLCHLFCGYYGKSADGLEILSMISCDKIGPRLYCRGVDDTGSVSFFVKTRIYYRGSVYTVLRGSIPLFWYQDKNPLRRGLKFSREMDVSKKAFDKHFERLKNEYGKICVINLLSSNEAEKGLSDAYVEFLKESGIEYVCFDLNKYANDFDRLKKIFMSCIENYEGYVLRVNCLDCMDRTNVAQYLITEYFLTQRYEEECPSEDIKRLFVENGHVLSNFYCGADSLKSELPLKGKRSFGGFFDDMRINANRIFNGRFSDKIKSEMIDTLLEKHTEEDYVMESKVEVKETCRSLRVFVFSWCINKLKFEDCITQDFFEVDDDCSFCIISLQKLPTSFKKLLLDRKDKEREKWRDYFNQRISDDFILVSTNFTHDLGILLFAKKTLADYIHNIKTEKQKYTLFKTDISVSISFMIFKEKFTIINNTLNFTKPNTKLISNIPEDHYLFLTGYFDSPLNMNLEDYKYYEKYFEYEKIYTRDYLFNNMHVLSSLNESRISFLPNGKINDTPRYTTRIFYSKRIESIEYKDLLYYTTGFRPLYGKFVLE